VYSSLAIEYVCISGDVHIDYHFISSFSVNSYAHPCCFKRERYKCVRLNENTPTNAAILANKESREREREKIQANVTMSFFSRVRRINSVLFLNSYLFNLKNIVRVFERAIF
jgi:hypothetical protein